MPLKIDRMQAIHLGDVRRLFTMMTVEHLSTTAYPSMDEEEIDNFILTGYRQLQHNPWFAGWVGIRGHKVIGFLFVEINERAVGKPNLHASVHWLYIHPRHRAKGVARRLLAAAHPWAREHGVTTAEFQAIAGDDQWERRGLKPIATRYAINIDDALSLLRPLKIAKLG